MRQEKRSESSKLAGLRVLHLGLDPGESFRDLKVVAEVVQAIPTLAMDLLRKHSFDLALLQAQDPDTLPLEVAAIRAVAPDQLSIVVYGAKSRADILSNYDDVEMDDYVCTADCNSGQIAWTVSRAIQWRRQRSAAIQWENHLHQSAAGDFHEALHQLRLQRSTLLDFTDANDVNEAPTWLVEQFTEILKCRLMTTSTESSEVASFVSTLQLGGVTLLECLLANSLATERILVGLGQRPGWFVLGQSHCLAVQIMWLYRGGREAA